MIIIQNNIMQAAGQTRKINFYYYYCLVEDLLGTTQMYTLYFMLGTYN